MRPFKAFVAKSFESKDERKTRQIEDLLDSFRPLGLQWESAERAEIESVSQKVRQKIDECDVFVGIFTRRHPIYSQAPVAGANQTLDQPVEWTGPPWLFQESGYALKAGKKLMLFRENRVELPELQGDLEYIPYDPDAPAEAWKKALEVLTALIAQSAGIEVRTSVSVPDAEKTGSDETNATKSLAVETTEPSPFRQCFYDLLDAEFSRDASGIDRAEESGLKVIRAGGSEHMDEIMWKCQCLVARGRIGDTAAIQKLKAISTEHPARPDPFWCLASVAAAVGEHKTAGDWYSHAASLDAENASLRINAATEYRKAKLLDQARQQLDLALAGATATESKAEIMKQMFWTCKESGDPLGAFCFGEAVLQLQPNDFEFRFRLAYAYGDVTGGYSQHDYQDLALFHYQLLVGTKAAIEYADNNLGVAYSHFGAPIHATEQYKAASDCGNALGTSNVIRQYLIAGFANEARAWAQAHATQEDKEGHIARALATVHTLRTAESEKIAGILVGESQHRTALADLATTPASQESINGEWRFPLADLKLAVKDREITGAGESTAAGAKTIHTLSAGELNGLWRFQIHSRKETDYAGGASRSYGLIRFSDGGATALVLEYSPDNSVATYRVSKTSPTPPDGQSGTQ
jgi:tetratricopeptide (TPR) repeat protein